MGAGDGSCVILMTGARGPAIQSEEWQVRYPASELVARDGASVDEETSDVEQAYANVESFRRGQPPYMDRLPWG